jgi:pSer/pThr/pTyr-binding forkhead associated (FHA) protein
MCILLLPTGAFAQEQINAMLSPPNTERFPTVRMFLDIQNDQGDFIHGLQTTNVRLQEDGVNVPLTEFHQLHPGVQFVTVFNPGRSFALRNSQGVSRYQHLIGAISDWAWRRMGSSIDDLSLLVADGQQISHINDPQVFLQELEQIDLEIERDLQPNLDILSSAIDLAADQPARLGMGQAILFITPPLEDGAEQPIADLIARANQHNVRIFIWMVASEGSYPVKAEEELRLLAESTGGTLFLFTGTNLLPDLEDNFGSLRNGYYLEYISKVRDSGIHSIIASIRTPFGELETPAQTFEIVIQPPDPAFISPPLEIVRRPSSEQIDDVKDDVPLEAYSPTQQEFEILVSFPDEMMRPLSRTTLLVDGEVVDENHEPPFEKLTWDIREQTTDSSHLITVEAEDSLGLVGKSIESLIQVSILVPEVSPWSWVYSNTPLLTGLIVLLAGAVLFLVLVLGGRIRPASFQRFRRSHRISDPVTQSVQVDQPTSSRRLPQWVNRLHWPRRAAETKDLAFLSRITESDDEATPTPIPITEDEVTIGSSPVQSMLVLDDPAVAPLHARLTKDADSCFYIKDEGTVAGTWLNYLPIQDEKSLVEHGDLIHIGRIGFRFTKRDPKHVRKPTITIIKNGD